MIDSNKIKINDDFDKSKINIQIHGEHNTLIIEENVKFNGGKIFINGKNSEIIIHKNCILNANLVIKANDAKLILHEGVTINGAMITLHETGKIEIGEDCMFSGGIIMDVSDMHSIIDTKTKKRINPPKDINIKAHVWLANGVTVLKGVTIGENSIIGAKSLVTKDIPNNSIAVGIPANVIKSDITWDRKRLEFDKESY